MSNDNGTTQYPRTWIFDEHGEVLEGGYVEINEGPAKHDHVPIVVLELDDGERVGVWLFPKVLRGAFTEEARRRPSGDFEPGERIRIERLEERVSAIDRRYRDFEVEFEHAAGRRSAAAILAAAPGDGDGAPAPSRLEYDPATADIPF